MNERSRALLSVAAAAPEEGRRAVVFGHGPISLEDLASLAADRARAELGSSPAFRQRIEAGVRHLGEILDNGRALYGVTTGFGESCLNSVDREHAESLARNLVRFHGCGTGAVLDPQQAAAVTGARLASLCGGYSAVRPVVLERLCELLNLRLLPVIPCEGSVGASGDLTPLSYLAAVLQGEREVSWNGEVVATTDALAAHGLTPLILAPKESLAMMNGTSVMAALAALAYVRAWRLARWAATLTAVASDVMGGNSGHFDDRIFAAKPHPGQRTAARWIREHLGGAGSGNGGRIQDRYSIRCAPHVIGVLLDALEWMRPWLETEINGANDNPLIDPETGDALHGGNFYGGHCCFVADGLKNAVANVAELLERQMVLLLSPTTSNGLPENLVARGGDDRFAHHGFKAMEISASALTAEALKLTMPASVFSRSTEGHNQDKVSMGTIAARDSLRVLDLAETVGAIATLALAQAADLRGPERCRLRTKAFHQAVRAEVAINDRDRRQDLDIARVRRLLDSDLLPLAGTGLGD